MRRADLLLFGIPAAVVVIVSDAQPLHLCPIDLRKLQSSVGFDVVGRYRRLADLYREIGVTEESEWIEQRLRNISRG